LEYISSVRYLQNWQNSKKLIEKIKFRRIIVIVLLIIVILTSKTKHLLLVFWIVSFCS